ncbi:MAG: VOC family protein [Cyclobacteriaceae bacterium]|nr:VOC family protein [Cyclobacteriaceae bacterium]
MHILQIKETCLYISDLGQTKSFYHGLLNFPVISHVDDNHIFFRAGSSVLLCFLPEKSKIQHEPPAHYAYGKQHIAFEVPRNEYDQTISFLIEKNIALNYEHTWPNGLKSVYFEDPDGHVLEIVPSGLWD